MKKIINSIIFEKLNSKSEIFKITHFSLFTLLFSLLFAVIIAGCNSKTIQNSKADNPKDPINVVKDVVIDKETLTISAERNFQYIINKSSDPFKIEVELKSVGQGLFTKKISENSIVSSVVFSKRLLPEEETIMEVTLTSPAKIEPSLSGSTLILKIISDQAPETSQKPKDEIQDVIAKDEKTRSMDKTDKDVVTEPQKPATTITDINFKRDLEHVKVIIKGNGSMMPDVLQLDNKVVIDIPRVNITAEVPQQVPVPIDSIKWETNVDKVRMVISLKEQATFDVIAYGDEIQVSLTSPEIIKEGKELVGTSKLTTLDEGEVAAVQGEQKTYSGKRISLDIQNADIAPILRLFADISGKNVVIDPKITGKINMKLVNVPWDQALDLILKTNGLSQITEGNILRIAYAADLVKEKKDAANITDIEPLVTKIFPVNYKPIDTMLQAIKDAKILSQINDKDRGTISIDKTAQVLIVNDIKETFPKIQQLIDLLDTPDLQTRQVLIEARLVEVDTSYTKTLGLNWNYRSSSPTYGTNTSTNASVGTLSWNSAINLPVTAPTTFGLSYLPASGYEALAATLNAYESQQKAHIISNPKVLTMNNTQAVITQGQTLYMSTVGANGAPGVTTIPITLSLTVTPSISPGGVVHLVIKITNDAFNGIQNGYPLINTSSLTTESTVKNGDTLVIGGIYKKSESTTNDSVPFLSQIPIIGWFFKDEQKTKSTNELMIFITPRVVTREALGEVRK